MLCALILYMSGGTTYSLKSPPNYRVFEKLYKAILFTLRIVEEKIVGEKFIVFCCDVWPVARTLALRLISYVSTRLRRLLTKERLMSLNKEGNGPAFHTANVVVTVK